MLQLETQEKNETKTPVLNQLNTLLIPTSSIKQKKLYSH